VQGNRRQDDGRSNRLNDIPIHVRSSLHGELSRLRYGRKLRRLVGTGRPRRRREVRELVVHNAPPLAGSARNLSTKKWLGLLYRKPDHYPLRLRILNRLNELVTFGARPGRAAGPERTD
jgi:hypothetical protein